MTTHECPECGHVSNRWAYHYRADMTGIATFTGVDHDYKISEVAEQFADDGTFECLECGAEIEAPND